MLFTEKRMVEAKKCFLKYPYKLKEIYKVVIGPLMLKSRNENVCIGR